MAESNNDKKELYMFDLEDEKTEEIFRKYFLDNADTIVFYRMTAYNITVNGEEISNGDKDPHFIGTLNNMASDLIRIFKKTLDNLSDDREWECYEFKMSSHMKDLINKNSLICHSFITNPKKIENRDKFDYFFGFLSPQFFKDGKLLGEVNTLGEFVQVYWNPLERNNFSAWGKLKPKSEYCENPR